MPIDALLKSAQSAQGKTAITGFLSGAAGGALASSLTRNKSAKKLLKAGGLLAVGGLALKAWQVHSDKQSTQQPEASLDDATFVPDAIQVNNQTAPVTPPHMTTQQAAPQIPSAAPENEAALILKAMIAAAHADGVLTPQEQQAIWQKAVEANLPADELASLSQALETPLDVTQLAAHTSTMAEKIEVFTASAIVIEDGCEAGQTYLDNLGTALGLPSGLSQALKHQLA